MHTLLVYCLIVDKSYSLFPFSGLEFVGTSQIFGKIAQNKKSIHSTKKLCYKTATNQRKPISGGSRESVDFSKSISSN